MRAYRKWVASIYRFNDRSVKCAFRAVPEDMVFVTGRMLLPDITAEERKAFLATQCDTS